MYQRIVVPLDGSDLAEQALPHAEELARLTGAPLHLVRVVDVARLERAGLYGLAIEYSAFALILEDERTAAREYLKAIGQTLLDRGATVTTEQREGLVARELLTLMRPGDLLVMASHGRGGLARWFLGSVAEEVVRRATVPVLLIRSRPSEPQPAASTADADATA